MHAIFPAILVVAVAAGAPAVSAEDTRPVHLDIVESGDGVELIVRGDAGAATDARFELEVESKGAGGTTRTVQSGANRKGGAGGVLLQSRIRTSGLSHWTARLRVQAGDESYTETRSKAE